MSASEIWCEQSHPEECTCDSTNKFDLFAEVVWSLEGALGLRGEVHRWCVFVLLCVCVRALIV
jgi:hypothetical protein